MKNLEQDLKNYYRSKRLASHRITAIQSSVHQTDGIFRRASRIPYAVPLAAVLLLAIGMVTWSHLGMDGSLTHQLVAEIGHNHRQHGTLVVESDQYSVVQAALSKLDFPIRPRRDELIQDLILIGGKYCRIQGSRAAQLKLRHRSSGIIHTLYVLPMADDTKNVEQGVYETNGVQVELWTGRLLLYALAHGQ